MFYLHSPVSQSGFFYVVNGFTVMIISKCCSDAVSTASTNDGYAYYVCDKCRHECDTTLTIIFHDTIDTTELAQDNDCHAYV